VIPATTATGDDVVRLTDLDKPVFIVGHLLVIGGCCVSGCAGFIVPVVCHISFAGE